MTKNELKPKASTLRDLIDYQEGSVVSRTLIDKKAGTVTLFAFDENQGLSEHTTSYDAMVYVLDGEVEVTISGKPIILKEGRNHNHARQRIACTNGENKVQNADNDDKILKLLAPRINKTVFSGRFFHRNRRGLCRVSQYDKCLRLRFIGKP